MQKIKITAPTIKNKSTKKYQASFLDIFSKHPPRHFYLHQQFFSKNIPPGQGETLIKISDCGHTIYALQKSFLSDFNKK